MYIYVERESEKVGWLFCLTAYQPFSSHFDKSFKQLSLVKVQFFVYTQLNVKAVVFQTIQFSIRIDFCLTQNVKTVLFQTIQFSISMQFSLIWPIDTTLSVATTLSQSGFQSNGNEGVLHIPQSSSITGASSSDCFVLYTGHSLVESYPSAVMPLLYSAAPADWAREKERD